MRTKPRYSSPRDKSDKDRANQPPIVKKKRKPDRDKILHISRAIREAYVQVLRVLAKCSTAKVFILLFHFVPLDIDRRESIELIFFRSVVDRVVRNMRSFAGVSSLFATLLVLCVLDLILMPGTTHARPPPSLLSRQRRVSDQRLAEIETLMGLENVRGKVVTVPVAFGVLDPDKIGRRRRSATNNRLEMLQRILRMVANNPEVLDDEKILSLPLKMKESRQEDNEKYGYI